MERNGQSENFRLQEPESHQADEDFSVPRIQLCAARHEWAEQPGVDLIVQENEVAPFCG
jgi:hypothetical protein